MVVYYDFFLNRLTIECRIEEKRISADKNQISELKMLVVMREGEEEVRAAVETTATTAKKKSIKKRKLEGNWDINKRKIRT